MRKVLIFAIGFFVSVQSKAQSIKDSVNLKSFLFEKFLDGSVRLKSGNIEYAPLNYNTDDQSMVFIKNGQYLVFADLQNVDTICLQQKKFFPINNSIYQLVTKGAPVSLVVNYTNKKRPLVAATDHHGTSKQPLNQVSNTVSDVYVNRNYKGDYSVEILRHYWVVKNDKIYKVNTKKRFLNSFPSAARKAIENYIATNNIDFKNEADLIKLVDFCNTELK